METTLAQPQMEGTVVLHDGSPLILQRLALFPPEFKLGTFGRLTVPGDPEHDPPLEEFRCVTVEQDWENNEPYLSCIPAGTYHIQLGYFHRGKYATWELLDVPGRSLIKFHRARTLFDLLGCIGLGKRFGCHYGQWGVLDRHEAQEEFMLAMQRFGKEHWLVVRDPCLQTHHPESLMGRLARGERPIP